MKILPFMPNLFCISLATDETTCTIYQILYIKRTLVEQQIETIRLTSKKQDWLKIVDTIIVSSRKFL
jgi:hypothetical protein